MLKKFLLVILSLSLFLNSLYLPAIALAQNPTPSSVPISNTVWYNQNPFSWHAKVTDKKNPTEIFGERYTFAQVQWIIYSLLSFFPAVIESFNTQGPCLFSLLGGAADVATCFVSSFDSLKNLVTSLGGTATNTQTNRSVASIIFSDKHMEISAVNYFQNLFSKFSVVKTANAQEGFGFGAMGIVQSIWQGTRNAAYALIVLIVIVFSFMIMFRIKISPQLVISVQSALPKLVTVLILATFSYAIAGLMIDLMYVFMGFLSAILVSSGLNAGWSFEFIYGFISGNWLGISVSGFLAVFVYMVLYTIFFFIAVVAAILGAVYSASVFGIIVSILSLIVVVFSLILCIWYTIKIPWVLIKALAQVYLSVIVAPLQIIFGALVPQAGFGQWLKGLIANLLVFPMTGFFFFIAYFLMFKSIVVSLEVILEQNVFSEFLRFWGIIDIQGISPGTLWAPPMMGEGSKITGLIFAMMSFMVIIAIPKVTEIMKMVVMGQKFDFGSAIGEAVGVGKWAWDKTGAPVTDTLKKIRSEEYAASVIGGIYSKSGGDGGKYNGLLRTLGFREGKEVKDILEKPNKP